MANSVDFAKNYGGAAQVAQRAEPAACVTASFFKFVAYLEVAVRNACHSVLADSQPATVGIPWYLDPNVRSKQALQTVAETRARIHDETGSESPDQIVAGLSFGFGTFEPALVMPDGSCEL